MLGRRAFSIVSPDSIRAVRGQNRVAQPAEWGGIFNSELVVAVRIEERPPRRGQTSPDSVMLRINAYDLTAQPRYQARSLPASGQFTVHEELLSSLEATLLQTVGALEEMSRAPRRTAADTVGAMTSITMPDGRVIRVPSTFQNGVFDLRGRGPRNPSGAASSTPPTTPTTPKKPPLV
jgi:hypothetical protein